jgi:hypothetical protein
VTHCMCGSGVRWCARANAMFDVPGMHMLDVEVDDQQRLVLTWSRISFSTALLAGVSLSRVTSFSFVASIRAP